MNLDRQNIALLPASFLAFCHLLDFLDFLTPIDRDLPLDLPLDLPENNLVFLGLFLDHVRIGFHCLHPPSNDFVDV